MDREFCKEKRGEVNYKDVINGEELALIYIVLIIQVESNQITTSTSFEGRKLSGFCGREGNCSQESSCKSRREEQR